MSGTVYKCGSCEVACHIMHQDDLGAVRAAFKAAAFLGIEVFYEIRVGGEVMGCINNKGMGKAASMSELTELEQHYVKGIKYHERDLREIITDALNKNERAISRFADMGEAALADQVAEIAEEWVRECYSNATEESAQLRRGEA